MGRLTALGCVLIMLAACGEQKAPEATSNPATSGADPRSQVEADLHRHIAVLASDKFEGRAPATPGEERTIAYLQREFVALGLQPGNGDSWFQEVPVTSVTVDPSVTLQSRGEDYSRDLAFATEMALSTPQQLESVSVENTQMVFVGRKGPRIGLTAADKNIDRVEVEGWLPLSVAEQVFAAAGLDYLALKAAATQAGFNALTMGGLTLSSQLNNTVSHAVSHNVVARIPGTHYPDEHIVHSAHWDHLGIKPGLEGDDEQEILIKYKSYYFLFMCLLPPTEKT